MFQVILQCRFLTPASKVSGLELTQNLRDTFDEEALTRKENFLLCNWLEQKFGLQPTFSIYL